MRILMVMPTHISVGGIETVTIMLCEEYRKLGHCVDFVCHGFTRGSYETELLSTGSKVYHIPGKSDNLIKTIKEFDHILKKGNYDVVHSHMNATSGIYLCIAKKRGIKVRVAHSHASSMKAFTNSKVHAIINLIEKRRTCKYANIKVACSVKAGKWLFGKNEFEVVMNSVNVSKFSFSHTIRKQKRLELGILADEKVLMHIGGFLENKNHEFLIEVFKYIYNKNHSIKLLLVGDGPLRNDIENKIKKYGLEGNVIILGNRSDVNELLQAADVFLLPSFSEGNPVSLVEAATSGVKCVISNEIARDVVHCFADRQIIFLPIDRDESVYRLWDEEILSGWKRIIYKDDGKFELSSRAMSEKILRMYEEILK